jgi:hypothetical protein
MRRNRMIQDIVSGGNTRQRWVSLADDAEVMKQELTMLQTAEEEQVRQDAGGGMYCQERYHRIIHLFTHLLVSHVRVSFEMGLQSSLDHSTSSTAGRLLVFSVQRTESQLSASLLSPCCNAASHVLSPHCLTH